MVEVLGVAPTASPGPHDPLVDTPALPLAQAEKVRRDLFEHQVKNLLQWQPAYSNLDHHLIRGLLEYGMIFGNRDWYRRGLEWYDAIQKVGFYADGFWHEGSPAYHRDLVEGLAHTIPDVTRVRTERQRQLAVGPLKGLLGRDLAACHAIQHDRMKRALSCLRLPNDQYLPVHDTPYPFPAYSHERRAMGGSRLLGCMGQAVLAHNGAAGPMELHLHYSGTHGHEHNDCLHMTLFARGREQLSETSYHPPTGADYGWDWIASTLAHNTVAIDTKEQHTRFEGCKHQLGVRDAVPGVGATWRYRDMGHGNTCNDGRLLLFCAQDPAMQVMEAEGVLPHPKMLPYSDCFVIAFLATAPHLRSELAIRRS